MFDCNDAAVGIIGFFFLMILLCSSFVFVIVDVVSLLFFGCVVVGIVFAIRVFGCGGSGSDSVALCVVTGNICNIVIVFAIVFVAVVVVVVVVGVVVVFIFHFVVVVIVVVVVVVIVVVVIVVVIAIATIVVIIVVVIAVIAGIFFSPLPSSSPSLASSFSLFPSLFCLLVLSSFPSLCSSLVLFSLLSSCVSS